MKRGTRWEVRDVAVPVASDQSDPIFQCPVAQANTSHAQEVAVPLRIGVGRVRLHLADPVWDEVARHNHQRRGRQEDLPGRLQRACFGSRD